MTRNDSLYDSTPVSEALARLIAHYGRLPVLIGALAAAFTRRGPPPVSADRLPDHIRADVGLPPRPDRPDWTRLL